MITSSPDAASISATALRFETLLLSCLRPLLAVSLARVLLAGLSLSLGISTQAADTPPTIKPGAIWPDDCGKHINAHGGGILKAGDMWYWFGEYRPNEVASGRRCVSCYSSTNLVNWKFRGLPIDMAAPEGLGTNWVLERPKVFFNAKTRKFVMYLHIDGPLDPSELDPHKA